LAGVLQELVAVVVLVLIELGQLQSEHIQYQQLFKLVLAELVCLLPHQQCQVQHPELPLILEHQSLLLVGEKVAIRTQVLKEMLVVLEVVVEHIPVLEILEEQEVVIHSQEQ
tara:strand:+ start:313 stop:648 length:336 start_codon:yes stop_codon:yes gene_type:complete